MFQLTILQNNEPEDKKKCIIKNKTLKASQIEQKFSGNQQPESEK